MTETRKVSRAELFLGFAKIGLLGFGGIAPWARHVIVVERRWLDDREYAALLGLGQVLPGPNTMNTAVMIGDRFHGPLGSVLALAGLMAMPLLILIGLAAVYGQYAGRPMMQAAMQGGAAATAGLIIGAGLKMARNVKPTLAAIAVGLLTFLGVGVLRWPMLAAVAGLLPLSLMAAAWERRR